MADTKPWRFSVTSLKICAACTTQFHEPDLPDSSLITELEFSSAVEPKTENLSSVFFRCFSSCTADEDTSYCHDTDAPFCESCRKQLKEWNRIMNFVSKLFSQANRIKLKLTAKILKSPDLSRNFTGCVQPGGSDINSESLSQKINQVVRRIREDFNCRVVLERLAPEDILECYRKEVPPEAADEIGADDFSVGPGSCFHGYDNSFQEIVVPDSPSNSVIVDEKSDAEFPVNNEAEHFRSWKRKLRTYRPSSGAAVNKVTCKTTFANSETGDEESEDDDASEAEADVIKRPRIIGPVKTTPVSLLQTGPDEFLYDDKYKVFYRSDVYFCDLCCSHSKDKSGVIAHIREVHILHKKKPLPPNKRPFHIRPLGSNEFLLEDKYHFSVRDGVYHCGECGSKKKSKGKLMQHVRRVHYKRRVNKNNNPDIKAISPTEFLYLKKYPFRLDKSENVNYCGVCGCRVTRNNVPRHMKELHLTEDEKQLFSTVQLNPNEILFGGKHKVICSGGRFRCEQCDVSCTVRSNVYLHIRRAHVLKPAQPQDLIWGMTPESVESSAGNSEGTSSEALTAAKIFEAPSEATQVSHCESKALAKNSATEAAAVVKSSQATAEVNRSDATTVTSNPKTEQKRMNRNFRRNCVEISPGEYLYDDRVKITAQGDQWACGRCNDLYSSISAAVHHIRARHPGETPGQRECVFHGDGKYSYGDYVVQQDGDIYKCLACGQVDSNRQRLFAHVTKDHVKCRPAEESTTNQEFQLCEVPYTFDVFLNRYCCGVCPATLVERGGMCQHIKRCHAKERPKYICEICGAELFSPTTLRNHRQLHSDDYPHKCDECGKSFKLKSYLTAHKGTHMSDDDKPFQCEYCAKKFVNRKRLRNHVTSHNNETPYPCDYCGMSFGTHIKRRKHSMKVHGGRHYEFKRNAYVV